ncbi:MAG TPA: hypothetical protein VGQ53_16355, partial [Chitinophagaceae bacterium]|nr:hypothetical protein [Chitinophagaceae bacterium]
LTMQQQQLQSMEKAQSQAATNQSYSAANSSYNVNFGYGAQGANSSTGVISTSNVNNTWNMMSGGVK